MVHQVLLPLVSVLLGALILTVIDALLMTNLAQKRMGAVFARLHVVLRWLLILMLLVCIAFVTKPLRDLVMTPFSNSALPVTAKDSIDELKWMLTVLAGFAVIVSIAQAAAAWLSALTYDKQATARLGEIDKVLESVKARYPLFYEIEQKRNEAHDALIAALRKVFGVKEDAVDPTESFNYMKDFYHELDEETRLLVLSVESFASIDLHPPSGGNEVASLKLFAVFYHAKYRYEQVLKGTVSLGDLERARGYLLLALKKASRDFTLYNELGNVYLTLGESIGKAFPAGYPDFVGRAKEAFEKSLSLMEEQQRANYNLAYILAAHERRYDLAVGRIEAAKRYDKWQNASTPPDQAAYLDYNHGCYLAQKLAAEAVGRVTKVEALTAIEYLKASIGTGRISRKDRAADYEQNGDVWALYQKADADLRVALDRLRPV